MVELNNWIVKFLVVMMMAQWNVFAMATITITNNRFSIA